MVTNKTKKKPSLGVFVSNKYFKKLYKQQILPWKVAELIEANKQANLKLYLFSSKSVDYNNKKILGIFYDVKKNLWLKRTFSYPNLLYRMGKSGKYQFQDKSVKPLNYQTGFNKYKVYEELLKIQNMRQYLPLSFIYKNPSDLKRMFDISDTIYLKGCEGGRGKQVIRVTQLTEGGYEYSRFNEEIYSYKIDDYSQLVNKVIKFFGEKEFLIQQAIDLLTIDNSIIDLRAEVQKNGKGEIIIAGISVRVSFEKHPISTHANSYSFEVFFKDILKYSKENFKKLEKRLHEFLFTAYKSIESVYGPTAEIGIDVGIDKEGRLWFIECNSCSKKVSFYNTQEEDAIIKSYHNLLEYAKYLYHKKSKRDANSKTLIFQPYQSHFFSGQSGLWYLS